MYLLAEATNADIPNWLQLCAQAGIAGVVLFYFGSKLVPALLQAQKEALAAFREEMAAERAAHAEAVARTHERIDDANNRIDELTKAVLTKAA